MKILKYTIPAVLIGLAIAGITYGLSVQLPPSIQKGDLLTGKNSTQLQRLATGTKGSILNMGASQIPSWFAPGSDALFLMSSSTAPSGLSWATASSSGGSGITSLNGLVGATQTFATGTATGLNLNIISSGSAHTFSPQLQSGYGIPLTASTTNWNGFYDTPSTRITAGSGLLWTGNTLSNSMASSTITAGGVATFSPNITVSTTTDTNILLNVVCASNGCAFNPGWQGTLADGRIASAGNWNTTFSWGNHATAGYLSTTTAAATYYLQTNPASYITASALTPYLTTTTAASTYYLQTNPNSYITASSLTPYLTTTTAASTYQPLLTLPLAVAQGGTGTTTPGLIQGANITITGTWPFQTITGSAGGGSFTTTTINSLSTTGYTFVSANPSLTVASSAPGTITLTVPTTTIQGLITLTTTGTSGAATYSGGALNIPQYQAAGSYLTGNQTITLSGAVSGSGATSIATAFASTTPIAYGGTSTTTLPAASAILLGNGTNYDYAVIPSCSDATLSKLLYNNTTRQFSCGVDQSAAGGGATTTIITNVTTNGPNFTLSSGTPDTNLGLVMTGSGATITLQPTWTGTLADNRIATSGNWNTAYTDRLKWDGGATGLTAATGRTSLGLDTMALLANTGSTTITTLGTITAGTWNGTVIAPANGGTGTTTAPSQTGMILAADGTGAKYAPTRFVNGANITITTSTPGQITIASTDQYQGTVTAVTGAGSVLSTGGATPQISLQNLTTADVLFGQGNSTIATSSTFTYTSASDRLFVTNASTTNSSIATNLWLSNIASGNCLQTGAGGLVTSAGAACGSGGGGLGTTTPFTTGYIPMATGTNVTLSNSILFQSEGSIGISTSTPLAKFVIQNAAGTIDLFRMASSSGATLALFDAMGHLQIGTTTDTSNLAIQGTAGQTAYLFNLSSSTGASMFSVGNGDGLTVMASSTAPASDYYFKVNAKGISASSTTPTVSSCGTSPSIVGSNSAFTVTVGSVSATTCTVTFQPAYTNTPVCTVSSQTAAIAVGYTKTASSIVLTNAALTSDVVDVHCIGRGE